ncbi:RGS domain-containing protein [Gilbertella persicaria]|uniref:RGS domain-containing protein n=1 Tax=Gilbertella persicaria TaxID=101096 RepID=UPI00221E636D|nr:RGS domain-containing protein [Gilbertella persicaria]KAI8065392.1 RGS domain-containing protein [Gilbertella persicaria]
MTSHLSACIENNSLMTALDLLAIYKIKTENTSRKLDRFFGESVPIDICVNEINNEGLKAILGSKIPLCYFLFYLLEEYNFENLLFFLQADKFEIKKDRQTALDIYNTFIMNNAKFEINLDDHVKRTITHHIQLDNIDTSLFTEAKLCVYVLLESCFIRFLHSSVYRDMLKQCGLAMYYEDSAKQTALDYLKGYLQHQQNMVIAYSESDSPLSDSLVTNSKRHYEAIQCAIDQFIQDVFV